MPWRKKKRWVRFKRKVNAITERNLGTRMVLFNKQAEFCNNVATVQGHCSLALYGRESTSTVSTWFNDLRYMANLENDGDPTAAAGETVADNAKMFFTSGVLDMTIRNTSTKDGSLDSECTLEVDVYELIFKRHAEIGPISYGTVDALLQANQTLGIYDQNVPAQGFRISIDQRGATPFEINKASIQNKMKVLKKTKFFIRPGNTITYQVRDPKRHVVYRNRMTQNACGFNKPGMTKVVMLLFKAILGRS
jgi:hypothetical protein